MDDDACMFCLCETPKTKQYDAPCACKPFLHQRCLNMWFRKSPNECPICRLNYEDIGNEEIVITVTLVREQSCCRTATVLINNFVLPFLVSIALLQFAFYR